MARIHVATWQSDYRGFAPDDYLAALSVEDEHQVYQKIIADPETMGFVAENGNGCVVGLSTCGPYRDEGYLLDGQFSGELYNLYVLPEARKSGVGRDLVRTAARHLRGRGMTSMMLWTFDGYASNSFYPHVGGRIAGRRQAMIGTKRVYDLAFGWEDTLTILS
jgi:ribosomal protein S18 acetylase RimI-like enzyme